jgi:hypothetical protein
MTELLLSTRTLPAAAALAAAGEAAGWRTSFLDEHPPPRARDRLVFYGGSDVALAAAARYGLALLEPPLDLLARLRLAFRLRPVQFARFSDLARLSSPAFLKPADPLNKVFDAGVHKDPRTVRELRGVPPSTPVLVSEPVEWLAEFRCFVREGKVVAISPYMSFGRPVWKPFVSGKGKPPPGGTAQSFCERFLAQAGAKLPPAFVVDVGLIDERGWAVVEFNPAWCAGILGADPGAVLAVLERACRDEKSLSAEDRQWLIDRSSASFPLRQ